MIADIVTEHCADAACLLHENIWKQRTARTRAPCQREERGDSRAAVRAASPIKNGAKSSLGTGGDGVIVLLAVGGCTGGVELRGSVATETVYADFPSPRGAILIHQP